MSHIDRKPAPELDPVFESAKAFEPVDSSFRARALARARKTAAATPSETAPQRLSQRWPWLRLAVVAGLVLFLGATGAVAAFLVRRTEVPHPTPVATGGDGIAPQVHRTVQRTVPSPDVAPPVEPGPEQPARPTHTRASANVEIALLQRAQASYADGNLPGTLAALAEHRRRFPNGRLAEEREALRVRSLARAGHQAEARRAFRTFAATFPHSVLLPHLQEALTDSGAAP